MCPFILRQKNGLLGDSTPFVIYGYNIYTSDHILYVITCK